MLLLVTCRSGSATKSFNTDLVHFLLLYHVTVSNMNISSFMGMISHMQVCAPKTVLHAQNLVHEKLKFMKVCIWQNPLDPFFLMLLLYFSMQEVMRKDLLSF